MEIKKVRKHTCDQGRSPKDCDCRKLISETEAADLVNKNQAEWVILSFEESLKVCPVCDGGELKTTCSNCNKTGRIVNSKPIYGEDITVTFGSRNQVTISKKTPRSPTIEQGHIFRALEDPGSSRSDNARARWDEFELLTLKERIKLLVVNYNSELFETAWKAWEADPSQPFPLEFRTEPPDNRQTGVGRRYDYGRSV